ncbi:MAG TPA: barstar family protein [Burkholderiaceae bacterium]|jgi:RNAse (barnase) inhibitor barstar
MATVQLNGETITDWTSFHQTCRQAFGFPDFYGHTIDAWVDCLSYLRDDDGMTKFKLKPDEVLEIEILHADKLRQTAPDILDEVTYCIGGINERYADYGELPALKLKLS